MFRWGSRKKKQGLAVLRGRVEGAQRALERHVGSAALQDARRALAEACAADERGDEGAQSAYEDAWHRTSEVRAELARREPARVAALFLGEAEELLEELDGSERAEGWLAVLAARVDAGDTRGVEQMLAQGRRGPAPEATPFLATLLYRAERALGAAPWLTQARVRVVEALRAEASDDLEGRLLLLDLCALQARAGDLQGTLETLAPLEEDVRDQALLLFAEAQMNAGDLEHGEATLDSIQARSVRAQGALLLIQALASAGQVPRACTLARELQDPERSEALLRILAARAAAGEHGEAQELLSELHPSRAEGARFALFEEALARGDFEAARGLEAQLSEDESRSLAWGQMAEVFASRGDVEAALSAVERVAIPLLRAEALELVGWSCTDRAVAHEAFRKGLELAGVRARERTDHRSPGGQPIEPRWIELATRLQTALGDWESALANATRTREPEPRAKGLTLVAFTCGRVRDLDGVDGMCAMLSAPEDRLRVLCGSACGLQVRIVTPSAG